MAAEPAQRPARTFELVGGHIGLDFVNTLDERLSGAPDERLTRYEDLVSFASQGGLIEQRIARALLHTGARQERNRALRRALNLREAVHRLLFALLAHQQVGDHDLALIGSEIREALGVRSMAQSGRAIGWRWSDERSPQRPLHELALAIERLLTSDDLAYLKKCHADDCAVWFIDRSHAGTRRWCDMKTCGNRAKIRRFRSQ